MQRAVYLYSSYSDCRHPGAHRSACSTPIDLSGRRRSGTSAGAWLSRCCGWLGHLPRAHPALHLS
jgi:hypothetical protein